MNVLASPLWASDLQLEKETLDWGDEDFLV